MKLLLQATELTDVIKQYLKDTYSLHGEVSVQELHEVEVEIKPIKSINISNDYIIDTTRDDAINRADHLGIKYRADISTEKLIERIVEHEEEILRLATEEKENFPEDELFPTYAVGEIHAGNVGELRIESDKPLEEVSDETNEINQEEEPKKKKKSIFDIPQ